MRPYQTLTALLQTLQLVQHQIVCHDHQTFLKLRGAAKIFTFYGTSPVMVNSRWSPKILN